ncbi:uncharacterized protein LOC113375690 [Ctenocephalides felis]|uniref:uncharacterized protein LOC113375690 n=1 Tax=Ctenocephalides felis TaxID=7515 RepID=UPI000E6E5ACD|nr:uncharacterized protein LOC113375690 [Ctenocephalides felis]
MAAPPGHGPAYGRRRNYKIRHQTQSPTGEPSQRADQACPAVNRPSQLNEAEKACESEIKPNEESVVTVALRKIQESFKTAFNATRNLWSQLKERFDSNKNTGKSNEAPDNEGHVAKDKKNCEYYECVFKELKVADENGTIIGALLSTWITNNVAVYLNPTKVKNCIEEYTEAFLGGDSDEADSPAQLNEETRNKTTQEKIESTVRETFHNMANSMQNLNRQMRVRLQHALTGKEQNCLQVEALMRCLSLAAIEKCDIFRY